MNPVTAVDSPYNASIYMKAVNDANAEKHMNALTSVYQSTVCKRRVKNNLLSSIHAMESSDASECGEAYECSELTELA